MRTSGWPPATGSSAADGPRDRVAEPGAPGATRAPPTEADRAAARELGSSDALDLIHDILSNGTGADRQLRVYNANRDITEVVREIADATEAAAVAA